eukprot:511419-Amphidinium_carterae.2
MAWANARFSSVGYTAAPRVAHELSSRFLPTKGGCLAKMVFCSLAPSLKVMYLLWWSHLRTKRASIDRLSAASKSFCSAVAGSEVSTG